MSPPKAIAQAANINEILIAQHAERIKYWGPIVQGGTLTIIYAPPGIGKTQLALRLAFEISAGGKFLKWDCAKAARIMYIDGEMGMKNLQDRLKMIRKDSLSDPIGGNFQVLALDHFQEHELPNMANERNHRFYSDLVKDCDVVFIDNLSCVAEKESSRDDDVMVWNTVKKWCSAERNKGKAIILIDHTEKTGENYFGTSAKERAPDCMIHLRRSNPFDVTANGSEFDFVIKKKRLFYGDDSESLHLKMYSRDEKMIWEWKTHRAYLESEIERLESMKLTTRDISNILNLPHESIKLIKALKSDVIDVPYMREIPDDEQF